MARNLPTAFDAETGKHRKNLVNWQNRFSKVDGPVPSRDFNRRPFTVTKTESGYVMKPVS